MQHDIHLNQKGNINLTESDILTLFPETERFTQEQIVSAIYFLCLEGTVVYVGKTRNIHARFGVYFHPNDQIVYDTIYYLPVDLSKLEQTEKDMIHRFKPEHNGKHNPDVQEIHTKGWKWPGRLKPLADKRKAPAMSKHFRPSTTEDGTARTEETTP